MSEQMTHRERVMAAIRHKEVDRLPVDYWGTADATGKLMKSLGAGAERDLWELLNIDKIVEIVPVWRGPREDIWGIVNKKVAIAGGEGFYDEVISHPLSQYSTVDEIEKNYIWPATDMFDYSVIAGLCREYDGYAIHGGYISLQWFYDRLRGTEQMLYDLAGDPELARYIFAKLQVFLHEHVKKILEAGGGRIDIAHVTDDFGTQAGLMIGLPMIRDYMEEYYIENIAMIKSYGAAVFHHDDGAMMKAMPWLDSMGIEVLNPLQWRLPGWDLPALKRDYGGRICFHGGIDNQFVLPFGTPEDVEKEVKYCVESLFGDKTGYILAPCHNVQVISPVENIVRMYEAAARYGAVK